MAPERRPRIRASGETRMLDTKRRASWAGGGGEAGPPAAWSAPPLGAGPQNNNNTEAEAPPPAAPPGGARTRSRAPGAGTLRGSRPASRGLRGRPTGASRAAPSSHAPSAPGGPRRVDGTRTPARAGCFPIPRRSERIVPLLMRRLIGREKLTSQKGHTVPHATRTKAPGSRL